MNNTFSVQVLAEKLTTLNNSQQSIETLSQWCISNRKKAKQVVETWEKLFGNSPKEKQVPFMYLANDILQNSRRKGSEFVNEFWKVLPTAVKNIYQNGDDREKSILMRLVNIWDDRKVFGSRGRALKDELLGKDPPPPPPPVESNGKSSQPIKIVKKDAHSIRIKLTVGCMPERIISAFQSVHDEELNEDKVLNKYNAAVDHVAKLEQGIGDACAQGNQQGSLLLNELLEQETVLKQCITQFESLDATRAALVSHLKEALQEHEAQHENMQTQLQAAKAKVDHASSLREKLTSVSTGFSGSSPSVSMSVPAETTATKESKPLTVLQQSSQPTTFASSLTIAEEQNKKAAAAVAAKLAALASPAQVLTSVFSSLAAEEAASKNGGLKIGGFATSSPLHPPEKRPKLERPMQIPDQGNAYIGQVQAQQQQPQSSVPLIPSQSPVPSLSPISQSNVPQPIFPPLPPSLPPPLSQVQQYIQSSGGTAGVVSYGYGGNPLPPPPPPSSHVLLGLVRSSAPQPMTTQQPTPPQQQQQQKPPTPQPPPLQQQGPPPQQQQQQALPPGFFQSSGMGFYGHPPSTSSTPQLSHQR